MIQKVNNSSESNANSNQIEVKDTSSLKIYCQMTRLERSFNPEASKIIDPFEQGRDILLDCVNVALICRKLLWNHNLLKKHGICEDPDQRGKWRAAIKKEFNDMESTNVWYMIRKEEVPKGRICIKCKWIFKSRRNGVFQARMAACGYYQVPVVDFNERFAPMIKLSKFSCYVDHKTYSGVACNNY
jgi:hypothetical protein